MMLLPKKVGPFTLMRQLATDGITESYVAILDAPAGKQVVVRRVLPWIARDPQRLADLEARVRDLLTLDHPALVPLLDLVVVDDERYVVEEWIDALSLQRVIAWASDQGSALPHNLFLHFATQICNGLEALHSVAGAETGAANVLHMALRPGTLLVTRDGEIRLGDYGLTRSPTSIPAGGITTPLTRRMEYLSPEQTHQDQPLGPSSDIFSLGAVLYELLALRPMFRAESNLQTIHKVRRAEVTTQLLEVKELLPGLDKVLYRALSLNPRHRYQRAFVLREDLRGLMASYSFAGITDQANRYLAPLFARTGSDMDEVLPHLSDDGPGETTAALLQAVGEPLPAPAPAHGFDASSGSDAGQTWLGDEELPDDTAGLLRMAGANLAPIPPESTQEEDSVTDLRMPPLQATPEVPPRSSGQAPAPETHWEQGRQHQPAKPSSPETHWEQQRGHAPAALPKVSDETTAARPAPAPPADAEPPEKPQNKRPLILAAIGVVGVAGMMLICTGLGAGAMLLNQGSSAVVQTPTGGPEATAARRVESPPPATTPSAEVPATPAAPSPAPTAAPPTPAPSAPAPVAPKRPAPATPSPAVAPPPRPTQVASRPTPAPAPAIAAAKVISPPLPPAPAPEEAPLLESFAPGTADAIDDTPLLLEDLGDLQAVSGRAHAGELSADERTNLATIQPSDPDQYTRAQVLLYLDAKARSDATGRRTHLAAAMSLPQNQYRPELLVEEADLAIREHDYAHALDRTRLAQRHWGRLPSELVFSRRAMMFEIEAAAQTGIFYRSDGEEMEALHGAIRAWERYREHALAHERHDLLHRADPQLAKLRDMQNRLE